MVIFDLLIGRSLYHTHWKAPIRSVPVRHWTRQEADRAVLNFVLDEVLTLLRRRVSYSFAAGRATALWASPSLRIVRPEERDELAAIELFAKLADQEVSFTDCVSFALMKRHRVRSAFAFDRHFESAGFEVWPTSLRR